MAVAETRYKITEEDIRREFPCVNGSAVSRSMIFLGFDDRGTEHFFSGFPYTIENGYLVVGPYMKALTPVPADYEELKKRIPVADIKRFLKFDLTGKTWYHGNDEKREE